MVTPILKILGEIVAIGATIYLSNLAVKWVNYYRTSRAKSEELAAKKAAEEAAKKAQAESDALKDIEGR